MNIIRYNFDGKLYEVSVPHTLQTLGSRTNSLSREPGNSPFVVLTDEDHTSYLVKKIGGYWPWLLSLRADYDKPYRAYPLYDEDTKTVIDVYNRDDVENISSGDYLQCFIVSCDVVDGMSIAVGTHGAPNYSVTVEST